MASGRKKKGGMLPWYTEEQEEWFIENLPAYVASRATKVPAEFWPPIYEDWFTKWPLTIAEEDTGNREELLADLMASRKEQIRNWFKNHKKGSLTDASATGRSRVLDLTGKRTKIRKLSGAHAYSKLYFETKIKPVVEERWRAQYLAKNPGPQPSKFPRWPIKFQTEILQEMWKAEPEDVKEDVRRQLGLDDSDDSGEEAAPEGEDPEEQAEHKRSQRAREYQSNIANLNRTILTALEEVQNKTGLIGTVLLGGPEPAQGGNISVFEYHSGRSQIAGQDFALVYPKYLEHVRKPFHDFASRVFPPSARKEVALPGTEHLANYKCQTKSGDPEVPSIEITTTGSINSNRATRSGQSHANSAESSKSKSKSKLKSIHDPGDEDSHSNADSDIEGSQGDIESVDQETRIATVRRQPELSAYERERQANILRNQQLIRDLDLEDAAADLAADIDTVKSSKKTKAVRPTKTGRVNTKTRGMDKFSAELVQGIAKAVEQTGADDQTCEPFDTPVDDDEAPDMPGMSTSSTDARAGRTPTPDDNNDAQDASGILPPPVSTELTDASKVTSTSSGLVAADVSKGDRSAWPEWMQKYVPGIEDGPGTDEFKMLLKKFVQLETLLGFPKGQGRDFLISKNSRPEEIGRWINGGRKGPPAIHNFNQYVAAWKMWWISLQPDSRQKRKLVRSVDSGEKWEELRKGSINGFFTIIISLVWWYSAIKNSAQSKVHREMVEDVSWVLDCMLEDRREGKKRARVTSGEQDVTGKKPRTK